MLQERRKNRRVKEDFSILCKIYRKVELEVDMSKIIDVSLSGVSFLSNIPMTSNDILQMVFRIPPAFKERIELFGRVIESKQKTPLEFKTRVAFINISPAVDITLNRLIEGACKSLITKKK
jgi:hypothetical protein